MSALLFIVVFALLLGAAQLLGWTSDSRDANDWRPTDHRSPETASAPTAPRVAAVPAAAPETADDQAEHRYPVAA